MKPTRLAIAQRICRRLPPIFAQSLRNIIYPPSRARKDDYEFVVRSQTGSKFTNRTSDFHGYPFSVHGYYDWRNWAVALACCAEGDGVIEIGANIGTETVGFADIVGKRGAVHAFEPLPANVEALYKTLQLADNQQNVSVYPVAVSDRAGTARFVMPLAHASGTGHILHQAGTPASRLIEVESVTLDTLASKIGQSRLIAIDTEGEEIRVLRGATQYIEKFRPIILLEASPALLMREGFELQDLSTELRRHNYDCYRIARLGLTQQAIVRYSLPSNWVCVPSEGHDLIKVISSHIRTCGLYPCIPGLNPMTMRRGSSR